jgi:hypothetical protein
VSFAGIENQIAVGEVIDKAAAGLEDGGSAPRLKNIRGEGSECQGLCLPNAPARNPR